LRGVMVIAIRGWLRLTSGWGCPWRNAMNPGRLWGAINPKPLRGVNRRCGVKPRAERVWSLAVAGPNDGGNVVGEWTRGRTCRQRGTHENESHERRIEQKEPRFPKARSGVEAGALKAMPSPRGTLPVVHSSDAEESGAGKALKTQSVTMKGQEGLQRRSISCYHARKRWENPVDP